MNWSVRRIHSIARINAATRYLEIGVKDGETFLNVELEHRDAVDPNFRFDTAPHTTETVRFFTQTSDAFWIAPEQRSYDIIMIDGLHTFEQTFRDLLCSMRYAHARTVWLIDDTVPSDVFSAIPQQGRCYRERQRAGLGGWKWHGDVFKIVPAIHDFLPTMNYATITGDDNPQTLVWYEPRTGFKPVSDNLETISRMTFFDMDAHAQEFHYATEDEAMTRLRAALAG